MNGNGTGEAKRIWPGIGARIRERRMSFGMEQQELGDLIHVSSRTISAYENEETNPYRKIDDLAFALQVSRDWLTTGTDMGVAANSPILKILEELREHALRRDTLLEAILEELRHRPPAA